MARVGTWLDAGRRGLTGALAALVLCGAVRAQGDDAARTITAVPLAPGESIVLDGSLAHPAWARAPAWENFVEREPRAGAEPPQRTRVQVLFDARALYVGVTALDSDVAAIRDVPVRHDLVNRTQDFVVVYIDGIGRRESAQFFRLNAAGSTADGIHTAADDSEDFAPDFDWDGAAQRNADGWTAVFRLPLASLRYADGERQAWRIMVARRLPREYFHLVASVPIPRDVPSFIHNLQPLAGVTLPEHAQFLTLRPSLTLRRAIERDAGQPARRESSVEASLDIKYRPRAELVIDGTLNPDFSQVALDVPQLAGNSRFALSFPEKRPFFFESADLLRTPTDAFYTRSFTAPRAGLRATWRSTELAGTALVVADRGGGRVLMPAAYGTDAAEQPASTTLAARLKRDDGVLGWGGVLAARRYADGRGDNTVAGPDLFWRLNDTWRLRGQWLGSLTTAQPDPQGGLARRARTSGQRRVVKLLRNADFSETNLNLDDIDSGFRHDTGFVNQAGVRTLSAFHAEGWPDVGPFNQFFLNTHVEYSTDKATGQVVKQVLRPGLWSTGRSNLEWWFEVSPVSRVRTSRSGPLLHEHFVASGLLLTPSAWWTWLDTNLTLGRLADADPDAIANTNDAVGRVRGGGKWNLTARFRPARSLELEPSVSIAWLNEGGRRVYHETASQLLAVWHLGPTTNLRGIFQHTGFYRPGVRDGSRAASLTWSWRRSAGTVLYVGAGSSRSGTPETNRGSEVFIKLQADVDEVRGLF